MKKLLLVEEVADALHQHHDSVYAEIARGALRAVRLGRAVRVDPDDLERFIADHKSSGEAASPAVITAPRTPPVRQRRRSA